MDNILNQKIGDLAIKDYALIQLFQKYKIDFYCKGKLTLSEGLKNAKINKNEFLNQLKKMNLKTPTSYNVNIEEWPLKWKLNYWLRNWVGT